MTEHEIGEIFATFGFLGIVFTLLGVFLVNSHEIKCLRKRIEKLEVNLRKGEGRNGIKKV